jgi:hypothetical protein
MVGRINSIKVLLNEANLISPSVLASVAMLPWWALRARRYSLVRTKTSLAMITVTVLLIVFPSRPTELFPCFGRTLILTVELPPTTSFVFDNFPRKCLQYFECR